MFVLYFANNFRLYIRNFCQLVFIFGLLTALRLPIKSILVELIREKEKQTAVTMRSKKKKTIFYSFYLLNLRALFVLWMKKKRKSKNITRIYLCSLIRFFILHFFNHLTSNLSKTAWWKLTTIYILDFVFYPKILPIKRKGNLLGKSKL